MALVSEWEEEAGYSSKRVCRHCKNCSIKTDCLVKEAACGSGAVKANHSCVCWEKKK